MDRLSAQMMEGWELLASLNDTAHFDCNSPISKF